MLSVLSNQVLTRSVVQGQNNDQELQRCHVPFPVSDALMVVIPVFCVLFRCVLQSNVTVVTTRCSLGKSSAIKLAKIDKDLNKLSLQVSSLRAEVESGSQSSQDLERQVQSAEHSQRDLEKQLQSAEQSRRDLERQLEEHERSRAEMQGAAHQAKAADVQVKALQAGLKQATEATATVGKDLAQACTKVPASGHCRGPHPYCPSLKP